MEICSFCGRDLYNNLEGSLYVKSAEIEIIAAPTSKTVVLNDQYFCNSGCLMHFLHAFEMEI